MKSYLIAVLTVISFVTMTACNNDDDNFVPQDIEFTLVGKGDLQGSEGIQQQNISVNDENSWNQIIELIDENRLAIYFEETEINFNSYTVIAVFDQIYGNGGHSIDITNIVENENNIVVTIQRLQTGNATTTMTQPFHIVRIPKSDKPVVFE